MNLCYEKRYKAEGEHIYLCSFFDCLVDLDLFVLILLLLAPFNVVADLCFRYLYLFLVFAHFSQCRGLGRCDSLMGIGGW